MGRVPWASEVFQLLRARHWQHGNHRPLWRRSQQGTLAQTLLEGKIRSAFAMTEPDVASSDATNIATRIERQGDEYVINGRKWWISGAADPRCAVFVTMEKLTRTHPVTRSKAWYWCRQMPREP